MRSGLHLPRFNNSTAVSSADWKDGLPVLRSAGLTLRELRCEDATALFSLLTPDEVSRFISPPPSSAKGFEQFIEWTRREREAGSDVCFGIVPTGCRHAVGLFQIRQLDPTFATAEWGFAIGREFWGTDVFRRGADLVMQFCFDVLRVHRLEARAAIDNDRGNGALLKIGAVQEGVLRKSYLRRGTYHDQALWSVVNGL
jgi:RimJ/RimL family protein N-acetyltransferase